MMNEVLSPIELVQREACLIMFVVIFLWSYIQKRKLEAWIEKFFMPSDLLVKYNDAKAQLLKLRRDAVLLNSPDMFVQHSRAQRQIIKIEAKVKQLAEERNNHLPGQIINTILTSGISVIIYFTCAMIWSEPIVILHFDTYEYSLGAISWCFIVSQMTNVFYRELF